MFSNLADDLVWWFFWVGIYVDPKNSSALETRFPMYILIMLFVMEKVFQRWLTNRYGCDLKKVREFKILEEKIKRGEVEEIKKRIAEEVKAKVKKEEEKHEEVSAKKSVEIPMSFADKQKTNVFRGMLKVKSNDMKNRGEEIVNTKEKLSLYFSQIAQLNFT